MDNAELFDRIQESGHLGPGMGLVVMGSGWGQLEYKKA